MPRLKPIQFRLSPETLDQLDEIARINGFDDGRGNTNRSQSLRHAVDLAHAALTDRSLDQIILLGTVKKPATRPAKNKKPGKKAGKKTSNKPKNCVDRVNTTVVE